MTSQLPQAPISLPTQLPRMIGEPDRAVQLRQGVITAPPAADGTVSVRLGGTGATAVAGVRRLGSAGLVDGEAVWVLQQGYDLLVLGKVSAWGVTGGAGAGVYYGRAWIGSSPYYGDGYAEFSPTSRTLQNAGNYALLADSINTFVNAPAVGGAAVRLRIGNAERYVVSDAGQVGYGAAGAELTVSDTNTFRANYGFTMPYQGIFYLRGYPDINHSIRVPAIGGIRQGTWSHDGPWIDGYVHIGFGIGNLNAWTCVMAGDGIFSRTRFTAMGGATLDATYLGYFENFISLGGNAGYSFSQRTRAWNDAACRLVWYGYSDEARLYHQAKGDVMQYQSNGVLRVQGWIADGAWGNAIVRVEDAAGNRSAAYSMHCPGRCAHNIELWPGDGNCHWKNSSQGWAVLNVDVVDQSGVMTKTGLRPLESTRQKVKRVAPKRFKRKRPDDPTLPPHLAKDAHHHRRWREEVENGLWDRRLADYYEDEWKRDHIGFTAEEMAEVFPEVVHFDPDGKPQGIRYRLLAVILWQMNQEQDDEIAALAKRVDALERKGK